MSERNIVLSGDAYLIDEPEGRIFGHFDSYVVRRVFARGVEAREPRSEAAANLSLAPEARDTDPRNRRGAQL